MAIGWQSYLAPDRLRALVAQRPLPSRSHGAALFADISGFTPLTEQLARTLGPRRGAEELTHQLNVVYDALIAEIERFQGSVVSFAGDGLTCWFDQDSGMSALACAFAMQATMRQFEAITLAGGASASLGMKVAVASGSARRFVVGNPAVQSIDVLAGDSVLRMARAEQLARKGEIVVDQRTATTLRGQIEIARWARARGLPGRVAVLAGYQGAPAELGWPKLDPNIQLDALVRPWILPAVYARLSHGDLLTELRPATLLFLRFSGIDEQSEEAETQLDSFIRWVQQVVQTYDGALLQVTFGDKGAYLYIAFGAPIAHEDDTERAVEAALVLARPPETLHWISTVQIGLAQGICRTGPYGGALRRTYGVLGGEVNLAARLMQAAEPGQILASRQVMESGQSPMRWQELAPQAIKGKRDKLTVYRLLGQQASEAAQDLAHIVEDVASPLIGREAELAELQELLSAARAGQGQIVALTGPAGMGKSRLLSELLRHARAQGALVWSGSCQSFARQAPYFVWQEIWCGFFGLGQQQHLHDGAVIAQRLSSLLGSTAAERAPLLGPVLRLPLPDNQLTASMEPQLRKSSREALLVECLRERARSDGLIVLALDDLQWADMLSLELLEAIGRAIAELPVLVLIAYRPEPGLIDPEVLRLTARELVIPELSFTQATQLLQSKLTQQGLPFIAGETQELAKHLVDRAQGNPFYLVELFNYLVDCNVDLHDARAWSTFDLPDSLHRLILSRIDQLSEREQLALKVASVIGRLFKISWLSGYYPELGGPSETVRSVILLSEQAFTTPDPEDPELSYLFRHVVTQAVAYESVSFASRARLHERFAAYLEQTVDAQERWLDMLAFHYGRSNNLPKKHEYLWRAGQAAQATYANQSALDYYQQLLDVLEGPARVEALLAAGAVLELVGAWDEARARYLEAHQQAGQTSQQATLARCERMLGVLQRKTGAYDQAQQWLEQARQRAEPLEAHEELAQCLRELAIVAYQQGALEQAQALLERSISLFHSSDRPQGVAMALNVIGRIATDRGEFVAAQAAYQRSLEIHTRRGNRHGAALILLNMGVAYYYQGELEAARLRYQQSLEILRALGDQQMSATVLSNLGVLADGAGDYQQARDYYQQALEIAQAIGDLPGVALVLGNLGNVSEKQGDDRAARDLLERSLALSRELGDKHGVALSLINLSSLSLRQTEPYQAWRLLEESLQLAGELGLLLVGVYGLTRAAAVLLALQPPAEPAEQAAQLLGAAEQALATSQTSLDSDERRLADEVIERCRAALPDPAFGKAWQRGLALSFEQALAHMLGLTPLVERLANS